MEQTITINVPKGKKAIYNKSTHVIEFINIRSKSWEEFCKNHPIVEDYYISNDGNIYKHSYDKRLLTDDNLLATREDAEGILAFIKLIRLHDEWVGDWNIADVERKDGNWFAIKFDYRICHQHSVHITNKCTECNLLSFPTEELAQEFLDCFKDLIEKAKRFI